MNGSLRDHPRVRGDDRSPYPYSAPLRGPPPRTRGRPIPSGPGQNRTRTTPAYAGTTPGSTRSGGQDRDHPRVRGDDPSKAIRAGPLPGPPPRTRGRRDGVDGREAVVGTTPAYAGTTPSAHPTSSSNWDHPRVRGDDLRARHVRADPRGPPPRTRGRRHRRAGSRVRPGTTPAYAGTTTAMPRAGGHTWDHPRVRGDDFIVLNPKVWNSGPPPRTRGRHHELVVLHALRRTTPAYAGTTGISGTYAPETRTTPAYAGTTRWINSLLPASRDHPRVRGDDIVKLPPIVETTGPPPRTRGRPSLAGSSR